MSDKSTQAATSGSVSEGALADKPKKTRIVWECQVCGYVETRYPEGLPDDYRCPICNAKPKKFKRLKVEA